MKILAISDIHGDLNLVKEIEKIVKKEKIDLILDGGDQTWFGEKVERIVGSSTKKPTLIVHGNHENEGLIEMWEKMYPNLKNIHTKHFEKEGVGFFGTGTTDWGSKEDAEQVFEELKKGHEKIKHLKKKIMISHCPPVGSAIELMGFPGSYGTRKAIDKFKPDFVICGHIHEGKGLIEKIGKTIVINVARTPTIFEI